jgi:hypothetical protein
MKEEAHGKQLILTVCDLRQAAQEGVIAEYDVEKLVRWASDRDVEAQSLQVESTKGFNLVTVLYYFGAMLMISACAWFLGDKWESLGAGGVLGTTLVYLAIALSVGLWLRKKGYVVGGGLLVTVAVCLVPLITYSIESLLGYWPDVAPGEYENYYTEIRGGWIVIELATMAAALLALLYVRFGFLTAPFAFSLWYLSMDLAAWILGRDSLHGNEASWVSVGVGAVTIAAGCFLDRTIHRPGEPRSEDFAFWCYLFGLMAFWGGFTSMQSDSELNKFLYLLLNLGLIGVALLLKRSVFLVFGAMGVFGYIGHLAYRVFENSFLFPFALAIVGLLMILGTVWVQSYLRKRGRL